MEVKGFRTRQDGALVVPPNGPWQIDDGRIADIYGNDVDHNPINQARANTLAVKNAITGHTGNRCFVHGLILVMLLPDQHVPSLRAPQTPNSIDIIVEDFDVFRYHLHTVPADEPTVWTGDRIADIIDSLGLRHLYTERRNLIAALEKTPLRH